MLIELLAAAGGEAAPENAFGFMEAMEQGGVIAWSILGVLVIMSVGSFYILITKLLEQNKILSQYKTIRGGAFWKAPARSAKAPPSSTRTAPGASWSTTASPPRRSTRR